MSEPMPLPVASCLKLSTVLGTTSSKSSKLILQNERVARFSEILENLYKMNHLVEFDSDLPAYCPSMLMSKKMLVRREVSALLPKPKTGSTNFWTFKAKTFFKFEAKRFYKVTSTKDDTVAEIKT